MPFFDKLILNCKSVQDFKKINDQDKLNGLLSDLIDWQIKDSDYLFKSFRFKSYESAINFINKISSVAEINDHHYDIKILYQTVELMITTHEKQGITVKDFIMAQKADAIFYLFFSR